MSQNVDENEEYELFDKDSKSGKKQDESSLNESTSPSQLETTIVNANNDHVSISSTKLINSDENRVPKSSISSIKPINKDFSGIFITFYFKYLHFTLFSIFKKKDLILTMQNKCKILIKIVSNLQI